ncbi:hypothetical protein [Roseibium album]|uniref:hypothetical protein n=1 Tax=Roseibium album TaxID=311410 RepID=UPI003BB06EA6
MHDGTFITAYLRGRVADISMKHATFREAVASLHEPKNMQEKMTYWVLVSLLEDEYALPARFQEAAE